MTFGIVALLSGCSYTRRQQCDRWQREGDFHGSTDSCVKCIGQLGNNKEAVKGCSLGLDAGYLLGGLSNPSR
jgi:hypothetical protein